MVVMECSSRSVYLHGFKDLTYSLSEIELNANLQFDLKTRTVQGHGQGHSR